MVSAGRFRPARNPQKRSEAVSIVKRLFGKQGSNKGFTLMELVVVLAVMVILVGILMPKLVTQKENTDRMQRKKTTEVVQKTLAQYYAYNGSFPELSGAAFVSGTLSSQALCDEFRVELRLVTDAIVPLEPGYYTYDELTGSFALIEEGT